jgi:predicted metal-dependent hydrolase
MSFSWRLLLAPEPVLAYVVEHEVAHLDVMDHSRRYWKLVEKRCPDYRVHEQWLRSYGPALRSLL